MNRNSQCIVIINFEDYMVTSESYRQILHGKNVRNTGIRRSLQYLQGLETKTGERVSGDLIGSAKTVGHLTVVFWNMFT